MLNSLIHFCKGSGPLQAIGYRDALIEIKVGNKTSYAVADFLTHSQRLKYTQICEIKSSNSFDEKQAETYATLDPALMDRFLGFVHNSGNNKQHSFDVSYICHEENSGFIRGELKKHSKNFPVVNFSYDNVSKLHKCSLVSGSFSEANINKLLNQGIEFDLDEVYEYIKFDKESDNATVLKNIIPNLLKFAQRRKSFTIDMVLNNVFQDWWKSMHAERKKELRQKLNITLRSCAQSGEVNGFNEPSKNNEEWEFIGFTGRDLLGLRMQLESAASRLEGKTGAEGKLF